jgi:nitroreductase
MDVFDAIKTRKSVRKYLDKSVEEDKLNKVLEAGRLAPSASNRQEWRFVVVRDPGTIKKIMHASGEQAFIAQAPLVIIACAETDGHMMRCGIPCFIVDISIALDHMTLMATELGLGTCWIGNFDADEIKEILNIPDEIRVVSVMPLGYPVDYSAIMKNRNPMEKIIRYDHW